MPHDHSVFSPSLTSTAAAGVDIVIHEIFGLSDWVRGVADQLAEDGFIALAPDLKATEQA